MKTWFKIGLGIVAAAVLVVVGFGGGWLLWGRWLWRPGLTGGPGMMSRYVGCGSWSSMSGWPRRPGMMGTRYTGDCTVEPGYAGPAAGAIDISGAEKAVEQYLEDLDDDNLEIAELMEFEMNYYAIVRERDTGMGAMELLVDKSTGVVGPEMGPNMMWNARYGMHRGSAITDQANADHAVSEEQALGIAQRWLDENRPGVNAEQHVDPFYGYYTIHTMKGDEIEGMLSVNGTTGQVWYHTWHGVFVQSLD